MKSLIKLAPLALVLAVGCHSAKTSDTQTTSVVVPAASAASPTQSALPAQAQANTTHFADPHVGFTLDYPANFTLSKKPDGVFLKSEPLGNVEDLSGGECAKQNRGPCPGGPTPMTISISVRTGDMMTVMKGTAPGPFAAIFPNGQESSFKPDAATHKQIVDGRTGYRMFEGVEDRFRDVTFAPLAVDARSSLEIECTYVGDMAHPKMSRDEQITVCDRVLASFRAK